MRKSLRRFVQFATLCAVFGILYMYFARVADPIQYPYVALSTLGYPLVLAANVIFLIFWTLKRDRWAFAVLAGLLLTWSLQADFFQLDFSKSSDKGYTLVTYNTQLFGFYQFKKNTEIRDHEIDLLDSLHADIFCFQEFYKIDNPKGFQTLSILQERMGPFFMHEKYTHEFVKKQFFGVVTLSKFPIIYRGYIPFEAEVNNFCIYSDILLPTEDTIRVFNTHLASIHFRAEDYAFSEGRSESWDEFNTQGGRVVAKLMEANRRRSIQIKTVMSQVEISPYPVIFAGDFNAPPFTNAYKEVRKSLNDAFCTAGSGVSNTYRGSVPCLRIDHVFHDEHISVMDHTVVRGGLSDHHPVKIEFTLAPH